MNQTYIIHGWDGSPAEPMLQWLKRSLEEKGHSVLVPKMPNPATPIIEDWRNMLSSVITPSKETVLIGHSIGCQAVLRYLETLADDIVVDKVILIAPWMELDKQTIKEEGEEIIAIAKPWMETPINFKKVKTKALKFIAIFSDNDPYVPLTQERLFKEVLSAKTVIEHNKGHFTISDNIKELPIVLDYLV